MFMRLENDFLELTKKFRMCVYVFRKRFDCKFQNSRINLECVFMSLENDLIVNLECMFITLKDHLIVNLECTNKYRMYVYDTRK